MRAPEKKTSLNSDPPVICSIGRTSTPSWSMGISRKDSPWWRDEPGSVRAMTKIQSESWAHEVQTFWPSTTHSPAASSSTARVLTAARSEPAPGSE